MERKISVVEASEYGDSATAAGNRSIQARPTSSMESVVVGNESGDSAIPPYLSALCDKLGIYGTNRDEFIAEELSRVRERTDWPPVDILFERHTPDEIEGLDEICTFRTDDRAEALQLFRNSRKLEAQQFTAQYVYGIDMIEQRYCVWIEDDAPWPCQKTSGITWVGVHGASSVCVVTRKGDLDNTRLRGNLTFLSQDSVLSIFRKSIISEIEDFGDPSSELRQKFQKCIKKPFGVVSANPDTKSICKKDSHKDSEYGEKKAIEFIKEELKRVPYFNECETTKTAIRAFQRLFRMKLEATEIQVSFMEPECIFVVTGQKKDSTVRELSADEIRDYLDDTIVGSGPNEMEIPM